VSDSKKSPKIPPPDDFSKTTPNINISDDGEDDYPDWGKTQVGMPSAAPADDWGKTVINYDVSSDIDEEEEDDDEIDFNKTHYENNSPREPDWGMTQAHINVDNDFGSANKNSDDNDFGRNQEEETYGATIPYFKLPESIRKELPPPTPTEKAKKEAEDKKKEGGVPTWFWVSAGLMTMFTFAVVVLIGGYFLFFNKTGFEIRVNAKPGSQVLVDKTIWGVSNSAGEIILTPLKAGNRSIIVRKTGYEDFNKNVEGSNGDSIPLIAIQKESAPPPNDCGELKSGEIDKAEKCANQALDNLPNPPNLDELLKALNLYYINFESGKHSIPPERMRFLERASTYIKQLPDSVVIEVGGHTDNVGSDSNNQALSDRRAKSVKDALVKFGVKDSMLATKGYGESRPRPGNTNSTDDEKFQNRRIEYTAIKR
jgi:outer membrane protein OmpA-like peptidoglycan-associated protein